MAISDVLGSVEALRKVEQIAEPGQLRVALD
jgi:hypothetical protein